MNRHSLFTSALVVIGHQLSAQTVFTVDRFRPADFKTIGDALASPLVKHKDIIHVVGSGPYDMALTTSKAVRIVGNENIVIEGVMRVQGIPAGETFAVVALLAMASTDKTFRLELEGCAGQVLFEGMRLRYAGGTPSNPRPPIPYLRIRDCAHVSFNQSELLDVRVERSTLLVTDSSIDGTTAWDGVTATPGLTATDARIHLSEVLVRGGISSVSLPMHGIKALRSPLVITGTSSRAAVWCGPSWQAPNVFAYTTAIHADASTVDSDPAVSMNFGFPHPPTSGTATFTMRSLPFVYARRVLPGKTMLPRVHAKDGSVVGLFASAPAPGPFALPPYGHLWLDLSSTLNLGSGIVSGGSWTLPLPVPAITPLGTPITLQAVTFDGCTFALSEPVDVVIGFLQCCLP